MSPVVFRVNDRWRLFELQAGLLAQVDWVIDYDHASPQQALLALPRKKIAKATALAIFVNFFWAPFISRRHTVGRQPPS